VRCNLLVSWIPYFILSACLESAGQIFFKKGANSKAKITGIRYYQALLTNRWIVTGLVCYGIQMLVWLYILTVIPLSIAFPLSGFEQVLTIFCSACFLGEKVSRYEWLGVGLIAIGISFIARS